MSSLIYLKLILKIRKVVYNSNIYYLKLEIIQYGIGGWKLELILNSTNLLIEEIIKQIKNPFISSIGVIYSNVFYI